MQGKREGAPRVTPTAFRRFALSLPEAREEPHFERVSFRVGKKIFATMKVDGTEAMVRVSTREDAYALLARYPEVFFSYGAWTERHGAVSVRLAGRSTEFSYTSSSSIPCGALPRGRSWACLGRRAAPHGHKRE
jgi:hypothetical protein